MAGRAAGGCLCGRYRFASAAVPLFVAHCHCASCRRTVAAPIATYVGFPAEAVQFDGADDPPWFESSPGVRRGFCSRCGTSLYYASAQFPEEIHLFRSTFDEPGAYPATAHVCFAEHEEDLYDDLPRYAGFSNRAPIGWGARPAFRILYLCTGNSARSILAEGITNLADACIGERRIRAHSAGAAPAGRVHPEALRLLENDLYRLGAVRSKSWDEFTGPAGPDVDLVITLCDDAAERECPVFPGPAEKRHWGMPDPASGAASFPATYRQLERRIGALLAELTG